MFSGDPPAGSRPPVDLSSGPPAAPVFPSAPTPARPRRSAAASAAAQHAQIAIENDAADTDKYAKHIPVAVQDDAGAAGDLPGLHAFTSAAAGSGPTTSVAVPAASAYHPRNGGAGSSYGSRRSAIARTRRWAVRIVVGLLVVWFLLMQLASWDAAGVTTHPPKVLLYRPTATTTTMTTTTTTTTAIVVPPTTLTAEPSTGAAFHETSSTVSVTVPVSTSTMTSNTSSNDTGSLANLTSVLSSQSDGTAAAPKSVEAEEEARIKAPRRVSLVVEETSTQVEGGASSATNNGSSAPIARDDHTAATARDAPQEEDRALAPASGVSESTSTGGSLVQSAEPSGEGSAHVPPSTVTDVTAPARSTHGAFTVVTVVASPESLVQPSLSTASSEAALTAADTITARRFEYLARGLHRSGLTQHMRFYEWLILRPTHVTSAVVAEERQAVRQWWADEAASEQRARARAAPSCEDYWTQLSPACQASLTAFGQRGTGGSGAPWVAGAGETAVAGVRVVHSQRAQAVKAAGLWLEAVAGVQTTFVILQELHWGVRLPAPSSAVAAEPARLNMSSGALSHLMDWYALAQPAPRPTPRTTTPSPDVVETITNLVCPAPPPPPPRLEVARHAFVAHLLEVGAQVLAGDEDIDPAHDGHATDHFVPPVVVKLGNFREAVERGAHVFRLQYYASPFDGTATTRDRERVLTRQLQGFLQLVSQGRANASTAPRPSAPWNASLDSEEVGQEQSPHGAARPHGPVVDGLPTALYGADQLYHCHRAPLYAVQLPVPTYMRGGGGGGSPSASPGSQLTLCDLLVNRRHHGYMANYTADPLPFYQSYCASWQALTAPDETLVVTQPGLKQAEDADARRRRLEKVQSRLLKPNRLAEGVCVYEWVRVLKAAQQKTAHRRPPPPRPETQISAVVNRRTATALSLQTPSSESPMSTVSSDRPVSPVGTPLEQFADMLYSPNVTTQLRLAHHFLPHDVANISDALDTLRAQVSRKLDEMSVAYVVANGRRRNKNQREGDLEVACVPSRTAVFSMAPAMYRTDWFVKEVVFKCRKRSRECVGTRGDDDARSMLNMRAFLTSSVRWAQGGYQVCVTPGTMVEDTAAALLASEDQSRRHEEDSGSVT